MDEIDRNSVSEIASNWKLRFDEFNYLDERQKRVRFDYALALRLVAYVDCIFLVKKCKYNGVQTDA